MAIARIRASVAATHSYDGENSYKWSTDSNQFNKPNYCEKNLLFKYFPLWKKTNKQKKFVSWTNGTKCVMTAHKKIQWFPYARVFNFCHSNCCWCRCATMYNNKLKKVPTLLTHDTRTSNTNETESLFLSLSVCAFPLFWNYCELFSINKVFNCYFLWAIFGHSVITLKYTYNTECMQRTNGK